MLVTSLGLILHHAFGVWHGDRRLGRRYGEAFDRVRDRTSIIPFLAILQGRQTFVLKEFLRPSYVGVAGFVLLFWWAHPLLIRATGSVGW
jgi:uncharacterized membrane protein